MTWPNREQQPFQSFAPTGAPMVPSVPVNLSSFSELLLRQAPELLPVNKYAALPTDAVPHGTTIVALKFPGGVVMAGDRRSTQGNMIAGRDVQKVYITDDYTATGIAGTAAIAVEFARLYAVELEHYEKLEGVALTFAGKVNRLATMVRGNLGAALQGFVALPLLAGYDLDDPNPEAAGRIVSFDAAGGWNFEDEGYQSVGSGSIFAKSSMKKLYVQVADADSALRVAVEALYDAADDDSATGGPDLVRGIYPTAVVIGADGAEEVAGGAHRAVCPAGHRKPFPGRHVRPGCGASIHRRAGRLVSFPYFISPEQAMRERSELARKGISRGRSVVVLAYADGVLFVAENPSRSLQKVSELYDRVGFAAVGRFNEFDNLRRGGIQYADTGATPTRGATSPAASWPTCTPRRSARSSPSRPSRTRWSSAWLRSRTSANESA